MARKYRETNNRETHTHKRLTQVQMNKAEIGWCVWLLHRKITSIKESLAVLFLTFIIKYTRWRTRHSNCVSSQLHILQQQQQHPSSWNRILHNMNRGKKDIHTPNYQWRSALSGTATIKSISDGTSEKQYTTNTPTKIEGKQITVYVIDRVGVCVCVFIP